MGMKVLVVGSGGREHAIAQALVCSGGITLYAAMARRNPGIARLAEKVLIGRETDVKSVAAFAREQGIEAAVIGPEAPLEAGIVDILEDAGLLCLGPARAAARLETDKAFCREMMVRHGISGCPFHRTFHGAEEAADFIRDHPEDLVIKPIGLTGGKGVRIMGEHLDRDGAIAYVRKLGGKVVLEERLIGEEYTLQAFSDGSHLVPLPLVQDHKRAYEGDTGPNTGGMGSYSLPDHSLPFVTASEYEGALRIMHDVIGAMRREGHPFKGILYGQFMNTGEGPRVIEFNARFGDPEAMNVLPLLTTDMSEILCHIGEGQLSSRHVQCEHKATVCKYVVPEGYPDGPRAGERLELGDPGEALVYYANVEERGGSLYTLTSRTLAYVGVGDSLTAAEQTAEKAAGNVRGKVFHRKDIGTPALLAKRIAHMEELRHEA